MSAFDEYVRKAILSEGGDKLTNLKNDKGRKTHYGITEATRQDAVARGIISPVSIEDLTEAQAITIYREVFWNGIRGNTLAPPIAYVVFDASLPSGVTGAVKMLQEALNAWPWSSHLTVDGDPGIKTIGAAARVPALELLDTFSAHRAMTYAAIVQKDPSQLDFYDGWLRRAFRVCREAALLG